MKIFLDKAEVARIGKNVVVKVPVTREGLIAPRRLADADIEMFLKDWQKVPKKAEGRT